MSKYVRLFSGIDKRNAHVLLIFSVLLLVLFGYAEMRSNRILLLVGADAALLLLYYVFKCARAPKRDLCGILVLFAACVAITIVKVV